MKNYDEPKKPKEDFRGGLCHYNVHGEYCPLPGSMGKGIKESSEWFCPYHWRDGTTERGKKIIDWAHKFLHEIIFARDNPLLCPHVEELQELDRDLYK